MKVTEQFLLGKKNDPALTEDGIFVGEHFLAVVDGVTSKDGALFDGKTGGRAAMEAALRAIGTLPREADARTAFDCINRHIRAVRAGKKGMASACVILYSDFYREIWSVGDCQCRIGDTVYTHEKEVDRILSEVRALVLELARLTGKSHEELLREDPGRQFILPLLEKEALLNNNTGRFGFPVLCGSPLLADAITVHKLEAGCHAVLASDGYPKLEATLQKSEEELHRLLRENPLCDREYCSTKGVAPGAESFDDRSYIGFIV